ncbi:GNAT family N-acetyltransferase [Bacillus sp. CGMCC 1.16607]|uniref:GNAT family N-acetyltransferase n=1 Tax=Bacillus sp. CGMCC 1.16607 TaxID=3351842 RepID=UPI00362FDE1D
MSELTFVKGYRNNEVLRKSFNELATSIFGIEFEEWYQHGFWGDKYIPYSFVLENKVVANVSVNILNLVIQNEQKRAIQIGTVMTHPDYQGKGYSRQLMNRVLEDYSEYDLMYLFANQSVLDFYPKFGFNRLGETLFTMAIPQIPENERINFQKLDVSRKEDLDFIYYLASQRSTVSNLFGTNGTEELLMFYCIHVFNHHIYYLADQKAIVLCETKGQDLHIYDVISEDEVNISRIVGAFATKDINHVIFHFTPNDKSVKFELVPYEDSNVLFVKNNQNVQMPKYFKHPITSQA